MPQSFLAKLISDTSPNRRTGIVALLFAGIIGLSFYLAYEIRFDFAVDAEHQAERMRVIAGVIAIKLTALVLARQLGSLMTYFSIPDFLRLFWAMLSVSSTMFLVRLLGIAGMAVPRGVLLADFIICLGGLCLGRLAMRMYRERLAVRDNHLPQQRIAIVGAGDAGAALAREFLNSPSSGFRPVMFFDDDETKHGKLIHNVPVIGRPEAIADTKLMHGLAKAVIAMPSASSRRVAEIVTLFTKRGIKVETLPSMEQLASGRVRTSRIRPVEVEDLLGREPVDLDSAGISQSLRDRVVLVTGAGGSIGSELCRQIAALAPQRLLMVEQAEGSLFNIEQELNEMGLGTHAVALVGDILDEERMRYIFAHYQPEIVFHAAAHKHVFMMERQPAEAIRNNVLGTGLLARMAAEHHVGAFVLISTDKAINPTSVMGATKRLAELQMMAVAATQNEIVVQHDKRMREAADARKFERADQTQRVAAALLRAVSAANPPDPSTAAKSESRTVGYGVVAGMASGPEITESDSAVEYLARARAVGPQRVAFSGRRRNGPTKFMAVRFGNVLGSSGSVIPIFKRQIANGGPVTVTHPDVTRYFMTIPESVGLVLQASILGKGGEIFVLDMGRPVKIVELARQMIELSGFQVGEDIEIKFTGLKPGEKLYEELKHKTELFTATEHPRIMRFTSNAMFSQSGIQDLVSRLYELEPNALKLQLKRLVPEYTPFLD